ncbi:MAG: hypothetical protein CMJ28_07595 [Phycisphaerae bacterium]|nr:hypothetical protein [Phycisphaerae bacterium]
MNNNIIPACIIGAGLFAVAFKPAPQPAPIPQAEPVAVATASVTGPSEPVIVWYQSTTVGKLATPSSTEIPSVIYSRAWSDGTIEAKYAFMNRSLTKFNNGNCDLDIIETDCSSEMAVTSDWFIISSPQMACRTDINGNGEIEFGDLLAVLNQWGDQATCPDTVQLQCGLDGI